MSPPPKFASFIPQKRHTPFFYCHSNFFVYIHQLSNARDCPFNKIVFNGSIRTSFTESYKIKQRLPYRPIYYSWAALYMRQPIYVGFSKTGSDTTREPNFDERIASDQTWNTSADAFCKQ